MVVSKDNGTLRQRALSRLQVYHSSLWLVPSLSPRGRGSPSAKLPGGLLAVTACVATWCADQS